MPVAKSEGFKASTVIVADATISSRDERRICGLILPIERRSLDWLFASASPAILYMPD